MPSIFPIIAMRLAIHPSFSPSYLRRKRKTYLQTRQFNQCLHRLPINLPALLHLLPTPAQPRETKIRVPLRDVALECGQQYTGHVLLLGPHAEPSRLDALLHLVIEVRAAARSVRDLREGEGSDRHHAAHLSLGFIDAVGYLAETFG